VTETELPRVSSGFFLRLFLVLVVCTGAQLEIGWLPLVQTQSGNAKIQLGQPGYFEAARHEGQRRRGRAGAHEVGPMRHLDAGADAVGARTGAALEVVDEHGPSRFPSRIEDVAADFLTLAGPSEKGQPVRLALGTQLRVVLFQDQGVHAFDTVVEQCDLYPIPLLKVRRPERIVALQRRKYFRESASVRTICRHSSGEEIKLEGWTRNVSGGGFALRTHQLNSVRQILAQPESDDAMWVEVGLPDGRQWIVRRGHNRRGRHVLHW